MINNIVVITCRLSEEMFQSVRIVVMKVLGKKGPILRTIDIIVGVCLLFLGIIPGVVYLCVVMLIRGTKDETREKICPRCGAKNLWTFFIKSECDDNFRSSLLILKLKNMIFKALKSGNSFLNTRRNKYVLWQVRKHGKGWFEVLS